MSNLTDSLIGVVGVIFPVILILCLYSALAGIHHYIKGKWRLINILGGLLMTLALGVLAMAAADTVYGWNLSKDVVIGDGIILAIVLLWFIAMSSGIWLAGWGHHQEHLQEDNKAK